MTNYLSMYMTDVLGFKSEKGSKQKINLMTPVTFFFKNKQSTTTMCGVLLEIVVLFNSNRIVRSLGLFIPIFLALIFQLIRFVGYAFLSHKNPQAFGICCMLELFKGLTFSLIQSSATILVTKMSPPSMKTTAQVVYTGTYVALGSIASSAIFNFVFQKEDTKASKSQAAAEFRNVFITNILLSLATLGLFLLRYMIWENLLMSRAAADRKIHQYEEMSNLEDTAERKELNAGPAGQAEQAAQAGQAGGQCKESKVPEAKV